MNEKWINLSDKVVIVTGGSMGIGKEIALDLISNDAKVISFDVSEPSDLKTLENFEHIHCDISDKEQIDSSVKKVIDRYGKISGLINNAGVSKPGLLVDYHHNNPEHEVSEETFDWMTNINQKGVMLCSQSVARHMLKQNEGVVINMISKAGLEGSEGQSIYSANKAAINAFTQSWAKELGRFNIRFLSVAPSINVPTPMNDEQNFRELAYARGTDPNEVHTNFDSIPLKRRGNLDEIANLISYLVSDYSTYITGTAINISGGHLTR